MADRGLAVSGTSSNRFLVTAFNFALVLFVLVAFALDFATEFALVAALFAALDATLDAALERVFLVTRFISITLYQKLKE
jgi:hypothetical protein